MFNPFLAAVRPSIVMTLGFTLLCGLVYPLAVTGVAQVAFPAQANGSLVVNNGRTVGSTLIGQRFTRAEYFHGRPSAAGKDGYDASNSSGSNLAPGSRDLRDRIAHDLDGLHKSGIAKVPAELVTTSASGLDPEISPEAARVQAPRIAQARGIDRREVLAFVDQNEQTPLLGLIGERRVNVLALNRQLDASRATKNR